MKNNKIYQTIKNRIVFLEYKPKQILSIKDLSKEFGVSPIPIREVLFLLENEQLISIIPNKGIYVTEVSLQELKDVFEIRLFLVEFVGKLAVQRVTSEELNKMKELLGKIKTEKDRNKLVRLDSEFHDILNSSTKNQSLAETLKRLRNQISRLWYFAKENDTYSQHNPQDIENIIKAIEENDQNKCGEILKYHTIRFIEQVKASLFSEENFIDKKEISQNSNTAKNAFYI